MFSSDGEIPFAGASWSSGSLSSASPGNVTFFFLDSTSTKYLENAKETSQPLNDSLACMSAPDPSPSPPQQPVTFRRRSPAPSPITLRAEEGREGTKITTGPCAAQSPELSLLPLPQVSRNRARFVTTLVPTPVTAAYLPTASACASPRPACCPGRPRPPPGQPGPAASRLYPLPSRWPSGPPRPWPLVLSRAPFCAS